jgi:DNA-binding LacI/PurR family transcriptional regulator
MNHGLSVPNNLSVAGFDHDLYVGPKNLTLTTIAHPVRRMAAVAMQMLSQQLRGVFDRTGPEALILGTLIEGQSTAPCSPASLLPQAKTPGAV